MNHKKMALMTEGKKKYDWYIDSEHGDNAHSGKSISDSFKTFAAIPSISSGNKIGLVRDSYWREELIVTEPNVLIQACGVGADPVIDCRDIITNASFSKTVGQVNVYQVDVSPDLMAVCWVSVWENATRLTRASSVANCDSIPGSYYPTSDLIAPITLYVHATDSSALTDNGKTYQYSKRKNAINSIGGMGVKLDHLRTIGNLDEGGSIRTGRLARITNCLVLDGNKHSIYYGDGSYLENVVAHNAYYGGASYSMFVYNENSPAGLGITHVNCEAYNDVLDEWGNGFFGHMNVSGDFGTVTWTNCTGHNLYKIFSGEHANFVLNNCSVTATTTMAMSFYNSIVVNGGTFTTVSFLAGLYPSASLTVRNAMIIITGGYEYRITANQNNITIDLESCEISSGAGYFVFDLTGVGLNLTMNNNVFSGDGHYVYIRSPFNYTGDYNHFVNNRTFEVTDGGGTLFLAGWQALTGQDMNSVAS